MGLFSRPTNARPPPGAHTRPMTPHNLPTIVTSGTSPLKTFPRRSTSFRNLQEARTLARAGSNKHSYRRPTTIESLRPYLGPLVGYSALSGALLGPLCDSNHSRYDVLHYANPDVTWPIETCWWVPVLFGLAAVILCVGHVALDRAWAQEGDIKGREPEFELMGVRPRHGYNPSWSVVLAGIASFVLQYWISGATEAPLLSNGSASELLLLSLALAHWAYFDGTRQGFFWFALTSISGPLIEIGLINGLGIYSYTHPDVFGIPTWIAWVYACGAPANGNLGRKILASLEEKMSDRDRSDKDDRDGGGPQSPPGVSSPGQLQGSGSRRVSGGQNSVNTLTFLDGARLAWIGPAAGFGSHLAFGHGHGSNAVPFGSDIEMCRSPMSPLT